MVGTPLEKERDLQHSHSIPTNGSGNSKRGNSLLVRGSGAKPLRIGVDGNHSAVSPWCRPQDGTRDLVVTIAICDCQSGIFQSRGKAHEKGRSFLFRSPLNGLLDSECCLQVCFLLHTFFNLGISLSSLNHPIPFHPLKKKGAS